jgi:RNA polymerase sigma-70 factor (ECF subfamily)
MTRLPKVRLVAGRPTPPSAAATPRAFEELLAEHLDALYHTALRLCRGHRADAEDLLQDTALRAFEASGTLRDPAAGRSWFFTILSRTHLNRVRSHRRRPETPEMDMEEAAFEAALASWAPPATPLDVLERQQLAERISEAMNQLTPELCAVVTLMDVEGFRQREVAVMLALPEGTIASRLFRARRLLRDHLKVPAAEQGMWRMK